MRVRKPTSTRSNLKPCTNTVPSMSAARTRSRCHSTNAARATLTQRGVAVSEIFHSEGVYAGSDEPYLFGRVRVGGPDPARGSYRSFASFRDPDGNGWLFQEITSRLAGRIDSAATSFASVSDLASAMRRASIAHGAHEKKMGGEYDQNWPDWYAAYMVAEQSGAKPPE